MNDPSTRARRPARRLALAAAAGLILLTSACGGSSGPLAVVSGPSAGPYRGDALDPQVSLAGAATTRFTATDGSTTTLADLQQGHLMLLYFGYTHCPDVCPTTMADVAEGLRKSSAQVRANTRVVFVTTDPERDTPQVLKQWLASFDDGLPAFVGLTAPLTDIDAAAKAIGVPLEAPVKQTDGTITVSHGAETFAFTGGKARVVWLGGTTASDYAHDLGLLAGKT